jgi:DNA gyrase/topoisomerase IV subunit B
VNASPVVNQLNVNDDVNIADNGRKIPRTNKMNKKKKEIELILVTF